jgi:aminocarboxymuconate-semialdehyde decarboxylase
MRHRREFLRLCAAGAIMLPASLSGHAVAGGFSGYARNTQASAQQRRQVSIGRRRIHVIDIHAHCIIPVEHLLTGTPLAGSGGGTAPGTLLGPDRLQTMDRQGVDMQALSINFYWWYAADRDLARGIVSAQNDGLAAWVAKHPDRFVALASVALQYPDLAAEQLEDAVKRLGMRGASIGGHVNGEDLSLPKYDPFWAKAAELGVPVFMHPNGSANLVRQGALAGRGDLGNIIGNPLETTYFLSRLIFDGVFDRFPNLRVIGAHAGGYLPSYLGRSEYACNRPNANCLSKRPTRAYLQSQILIDTMVFSEEGLRHLVAEVGSSQVVYGTDVPYAWPVTVDLVLEAAFLSDAQKEAILGGNLARLLRIPAV